VICFDTNVDVSSKDERDEMRDSKSCDVQALIYVQ
jgi:hypothetical protein